VGLLVAYAIVSGAFVVAVGAEASARIWNSLLCTRITFAKVAAGIIAVRAEIANFLHDLCICRCSNGGE